MLTIVETGKRLRQRQISPVEIARECLARIEQFDSVLNTFILVTAESALAQARQAESEIMRGEWRGPLHGIPIGIKDIIDVAGLPTTCASRLFEHRIAEHDADVVRALKNAGAVILGKQNMHEFAYGGSSLISGYGAVRNAWSPSHIPGGSSGGSASAVAAGFGYAAVGTDTGGSVREPAALCGVVGLKATYGVISACGAFPLSPSLDHVGPIARCAGDAGLLFDAMTAAGFNDTPDRLDLRGKNPASQSPITIGIPRRFFYEDLDAEIASAVDQALVAMAELGCEVRDFDFAECDLEAATSRMLLAAEAYAVHKKFVSESRDLYQPETLRRILAGADITQEKIIEERSNLNRARQNIAELFQDIDVLITPTTPIPAPSIAELKSHLEQLRPTEVILLRNTRPFNFWGLPAISIPCGFTRKGLPIGLQIVGAPGGERQILQLAAAYEQATTWRERDVKLSRP